MKGFVEIITASILIIAALMLLSGNNLIAEENSPGQEIAKATFVLAQFEKTIQKATFDCEWETENSLNNCVSQKAAELIQEIKGEKFSCISQIQSTNMLANPKTLEIKFTCKTNYLSPKNTRISFSKNIILEKNKAFDGLVMWLKMSNNSLDYSGNKNNATINTGSFTNGIEGVENSGQLFVGNAQYAKINSSTTLNTGNSITIISWIYPLGTNIEPIIEYNNGIIEGVTLRQFDSFDKLYANFVDTSGNSHILSSDVGVIETGKWQQIAATYNGTTAILYKNGQKVAEQNVGSFILQTSYDLYVAKNPNGIVVDPNMQIDEIMVFSKSLTQEDIQYIYSLQKP